MNSPPKQGNLHYTFYCLSCLTSSRALYCEVSGSTQSIRYAWKPINVCSEPKASLACCKLTLIASSLIRCWCWTFTRIHQLPIVISFKRSDLYLHSLFGSLFTLKPCSFIKPNLQNIALVIVLSYTESAGEEGLITVNHLFWSFLDQSIYAAHVYLYCNPCNLIQLVSVFYHCIMETSRWQYRLLLNE